MAGLEGLMIIAPIASQNTPPQATALGRIKNEVTDAEGQAYLLRHGGIEAVTPLLESANPAVTAPAVGVFLNACGTDVRLTVIRVLFKSMMMLWVVAVGCLLL